MNCWKSEFVTETKTKRLWRDKYGLKNRVTNRINKPFFETAIGKKAAQKEAATDSLHVRARRDDDDNKGSSDEVDSFNSGNYNEFDATQ